MAATIVMVHGMWGGGWYWEHYKRFFEAEGFECLTPDLRYHNVAPTDPPDPRLGSTSLLDYARDLEQLVQSLDEPPILMGHSMGGLLVQILASLGVGKAAVLLTPASPWGINALKLSVLWSFKGPLTKWAFWKKPSRLSFKAAVYSCLHLMPEEDRKRIYGKMVYESGRTAGEIGFWPLDYKMATRVDKSKVTCPVLIVAGAEDRITPASVVRKIQAKYKKVSTYIEFPNHAHWVVGEPGWEEITGYILKWLRAREKIT